MPQPPFLQTPTDYHKFFKLIHRHASEAADKCLSIPNDVLALFAEAFPDVFLDVDILGLRESSLAC